MSATLQSGADLQQPPQHHDLHNLNKIEAPLTKLPSAIFLRRTLSNSGGIYIILSSVQFRHCGRQAIVSGLLGRPKIQSPELYTCCKPSYNHPSQSKFYSKGICTKRTEKHSVIITSLLPADVYHSDGIRALENLESESKNTDNFCRGYFLHWP